MKKIAIVQGDKEQCGVYQYGLSTFRILQKSKKYEYVLVPVTGTDIFLHWVNQNKPDAIIFNYDSNLLHWFNDNIGNYLSCLKFMMIGHEPRYLPNYSSSSANFVISPNIIIPDKKCFNIPRPVVDVNNIKYSPPNGTIKIGNFGFGWYTKEYAKIIKHVNEQFKDEKVILNFNIGLGEYVDKTGVAAKNLANECKSLINSNVELNISHDFLDIDQLITFLNGNDINIFYYGQSGENSLPICSSSTDYALAARKPIAVNNSHMFKHIINDDIDIDKTPIKKIIEQGLKPLESIHQTFSEDNFRNCFESVFAKFL